jgi:hypothetical protein
MTDEPVPERTNDSVANEHEPHGQAERDGIVDQQDAVLSQLEDDSVD